MKKLAHATFGLTLVLVLLLPHVSLGADLPTILNCRQNAMAVRDFGFQEKKWMAGVPDRGTTFEVSERDPSLGKTFYDRVFAALDTENPVISSTRFIAMQGRFEKVETAEFRGRVVGRFGDTVFVTWRNPPQNKAWLAVLDLTHLQAAIGYVFQGMTSVGVEAQTFDCR